MGRSVDGYMYDYEALIQKCMELCKTDDRETVHSILMECGVVYNDMYIILNNELWDNGNPYYSVSTALELVFDVRDANIFSKAFLSSEPTLERKELVNTIEAEDEIELANFYREKLGKEPVDYEEGY